MVIFHGIVVVCSDLIFSVCLGVFGIRYIRLYVIYDSLYTILYIRFQEVLSIYKIGFWCELTIATSYLVKCRSLFWSKIYIDV